MCAHKRLSLCVDPRTHVNELVRKPPGLGVVADIHLHVGQAPKQNFIIFSWERALAPVPALPLYRCLSGSMRWCRIRTTNTSPPF